MTSVDELRKEEAGAQLALIHSLADNITKNNYADKRLQILRATERLGDTLTSKDQRIRELEELVAAKDKALEPFERIAAAEDYAGTKDGESIIVNVTICRNARAARLLGASS